MYSKSMNPFFVNFSLLILQMNICMHELAKLTRLPIYPTIDISLSYSVLVSSVRIRLTNWRVASIRDSPHYYAILRPVNVLTIG